MSKLSGQDEWEATFSTFRGQIVSATVHKMMVIMRLADQKAQVLIFLNSILIPVCINEIEHSTFQNAAIISIVTSVLSILAAMVCIYPRRSYRKPGHRDMNLLHFNDIGHLKKDEFIDLFMPVYNDAGKFTETVVYDLYDMSRHSLIPKFMWLKISYGIFTLGNMLAVVMALIEV